MYIMRMSRGPPAAVAKILTVKGVISQGCEAFITVLQTRLSEVPSASHDDVITQLGPDKHCLQGLPLFVGA